MQGLLKLFESMWLQLEMFQVLFLLDAEQVDHVPIGPSVKSRVSAVCSSDRRQNRHQVRRGDPG